MDAVHDMGGMDGFGKVVPEPNEPVFHEEWEGRVMAMNRALGAAGAWTIDMARSAREALPPDVYLSSSYYERWQLALETMLAERGLVDPDELAAGRSLYPARLLPRGRFTTADVARVTTRGSFDRPATAPARFAPGDAVRARNVQPRTHTRLPRYVRGHLGTVERVQGCHAFPDARALGRDEPAWLYTVCFEGPELWGDDADPRSRISVEAFEPYLDPA
jgi:nitrile hydratase beta subunit